MSMKGRPFVHIAVLASLLLLAGFAVPVAATNLAYAGQTITIAAPGPYVLTNDIAESTLATCIEIRASDVVLDGGGHLIDGAGAAGSTGISVKNPSGVRNVTIRNVRVRDWDFGVYLHGAVDSRIEASLLEQNLFCGAVIYLDATGNTIAGCTVTGNGNGIVLSTGAADCVVRENRIEGNECGIYLYDSDGVAVTRNLIGSSTDAGIRYSLSGNGTVYDNRFENDLNVAFTGGSLANAWSVGPRAGPNVVAGPSIGGNFWGRPDGTGFSELTADGNRDGFADLPFAIAPQNVDDHPLAPSVGFVPTPEPTPTFEPPEQTPTPEPPDPTPTAEPPPSTAVPSIPIPVPTTPGVVMVPGGAGIPTDTNGDGLYDDVNGNGRKDFNDVVLFFNQMAWITGHSSIPPFDYNKNGRIDFADIVTLFMTL
jgi:parallel beta-helix repeat protein